VEIRDARKNPDMSGSPSPQATPLDHCTLDRCTLILTISLLVALTGLAACAGGTAGGNFQGGGGGGGGGGGNPGPNCVTAVTASVAPAISQVPTTSAGVGTITPSAFMDLHVGSPNIIPDVSIPYGSLRLWDTGTGWSQINTASGVFDFSPLDGFVNAAPSGVDLLYNLARVPTWASSKPTDSSCSYDTSGEGGPGQCDPPVDLNNDGTGTDQDWINWVSAVAARNASTYNNKIKYFEIWNEWNISLFWTGTPAQLVRMEQDARCVVEGPPSGKSCNPNSTFPSGMALDPAAKIVSPSPVGAATDLNEVSLQLTSYFGTVVGGNNGGTFADEIGFHGYVSTQSSSDPCPVPENVNTVVDDLNNTVQSFPNEAAGKPWFDTEDSWGKAPDEGFGDPDRQAAFLARDILLQRSLGVSRIYWYRWDATQTYGGALWTAADGITEAGTADGIVNGWLEGATLSSACTVSGTVWQCGFTDSGGKALAVWDASQDCLSGTCGTTNFTVPSGYTQYVDLTGNVTSVSGTTVPIGAKPILLENSSF
jgi:hypothetical protein